SVSGTVIQIAIPAFDGFPGTLAVVVTTPGGESNEADYALAAWPPVEQVYPLCSLGGLKAILGIPPTETGDDSKYLALIQAASATINRETGLDFRQAVLTGELQDGDSSPLL